MKKAKSPFGAVVGLALVFGLALSALALNPAPADAQLTLRVNGKPFHQWSALWWQWALSIPADVNPMIGNNSPDIDQRDDVWFLAGIWGGGTAAERTSIVPAGRHIFFPIANAMWIQTPLDNPDLKLRHWRQIVHEYLAPYGGTLECTLDGKKVVFNRNTPIVRCQSAVFTAEFPADNVFGLDPAMLTGYPIVSDGYWVMLPPLTPGEHVLWFRSDAASSGVTYHLTVN